MEEACAARPTCLLYRRRGPFRLEASYTRAFEQLGWRVDLFETEEDNLRWWLRSRIGRRITRGSLRLRSWGADRRNEAFCAAARHLAPDLVLVVKGELVMPEMVSSLRRVAGAVGVLHPDAPVPGYSSYRPEQLAVAREADFCFIWSRRLKQRLEDRGIERAVYLPFAWDPDVFPYRSNPQETGPDVVFVGGWDEHRERWLEPVAENFELEVWGPDYWGTRTRTGSRLRDCWQGGDLWGPEAAEILHRSRVVLNVLRKQNLPDGTNMRTFEVPGTGSFLLSTRTSGATEIYPEGEAGAYFGSIEEMLEKIAHYLERPGERESLARRAHRITRRGHRYVHRARRIVGTLGGL